MEHELTYINKSLNGKKTIILIENDLFNVEDINDALINEDFIVYKSIKELSQKIEDLLICQGNVEKK